MSSPAVNPKRVSYNRPLVTSLTQSTSQPSIVGRDASVLADDRPTSPGGVEPDNHLPLHRSQSQIDNSSEDLSSLVDSPVGRNVSFNFNSVNGSHLSLSGMRQRSTVERRTKSAAPISEEGESARYRRATTEKKLSSKSDDDDDDSTLLDSSMGSPFLRSNAIRGRTVSDQITSESNGVRRSPSHIERTTDDTISESSHSIYDAASVAGSIEADMASIKPLRQNSVRNISANPEEAMVYVWICCDKFGVRYEHRYTLYLSSLRTIFDLKKQVLSQAELEYRDALPPNSNLETAMAGFDRQAFLRSWVHLKGSSVLLADQQPAYVLAWHLAYKIPEYAKGRRDSYDLRAMANQSGDGGQKRTIQVYMELYKQECSYPEKIGILKKQGGGMWKMLQRKRFTLRRGRLTYTKDGKDPGKQKEIPLSQFEVRDIKEKGRELDFEIVTANRYYHLQALTMRDKLSWMKELDLLLAASLNHVKNTPMTEEAVVKADFCANCKTKFGFWSMRHQCSVCQLVFDDHCYDKSSLKCITCVPRMTARHLSTKPRLEKPASICGTVPKKLSLASAPDTGPVIQLEMSECDEVKEITEPTLEIHISQAFNLMASDKNGLSDPYVVVYFEDQEYRTETIMETLDPQWDENFTIKVKGSSHVIWIGVYDADKYLKDDFLGMVCIPLYNLASGVKYTRWYPLHGRPGRYGRGDGKVRGEIELSLRYTFSWKEYLKPLNEAKGGSDESLNMSTRFLHPPLNTNVIADNFGRVERLMHSLHLGEISHSLEQVLQWKQPSRTLLYYIAFVYLCLHFPGRLLPALFPAVALFFLCTNMIEYKYFGRGMEQMADSRLPPSLEMSLLRAKTQAEDHTNVHRTSSSLNQENNPGSRYDPYSDSDDSDMEVDLTTVMTNAKEVVNKPLSWIKRQREKLKEVTIYQNRLGYYASMGERFSSLMMWYDPVQSRMLLYFLLSLTVVLVIVPFRVALILGGTVLFFKHLVRRGALLRTCSDPKEIEREMELQDDRPSALSNFINRAPMPWELVCTVRSMPKGLKRAS